MVELGSARSARDVPREAEERGVTPGVLDSGDRRARSQKDRPHRLEVTSRPTRLVDQAVGRAATVPAAVAHRHAAKRCAPLAFASSTASSWRSRPRSSETTQMAETTPAVTVRTSIVRTSMSYCVGATARA